MKKLIVIIILAMTSVTLADVEITITIPAAKVQDFRTAFLVYLPIPTVEVYDPNEPGVAIATEPKYGEKVWIKRCIIDWLKRCYRKGKIKISQQTTITDPNIVE